MISFLFILAGTSCLCLAMSRHYRQLFRNRSLSTRKKAILNTAGYTCLALGLFTCTQSMGPAVGGTAFVAYLSVAIFSLALILTLRATST